MSGGSGDFHVLVSGVPFGCQDRRPDDTWLTARQVANLEAVSPRIVLHHVSPDALNDGNVSLPAANAFLVETSGMDQTDPDLPAMVFGPTVTRLISSDLVFIQSCSAGVEHLIPLVPPGLTVCNASGVHANAIAETVIAAILGRAKMLDQRRQDQKARLWRQLPCREVVGSTVCVLGVGRIGTAVARLARALDIHTVGIRRGARGTDHPGTNPPDHRGANAPDHPGTNAPDHPGTNAPDHPGTNAPDHFGTVFSVGDRKAALSQADYLVVACPLTDETRGLIGKEELSALKPGAYLLNVARGAIVDEAALLDALRTGQLSGAFLDAHAQEPLPPDHPLWDMPGVEISPHDSHASQLMGDRHVSLFCENLRRCLSGKPLLNVVDAGRGY
jgi:phosphoglycerate dehydrogenase-like enzyme